MDPILAGIISSISTTLVGGIGLWVYRIIKLKGEQTLKQKAKDQETKREDDSRYIEELYRLVGALRKELDEVKKEKKEGEEAHRLKEQEHSQCRERIARLEAWYEATTGHHLPELHGSDVHRSLPPGSGRVTKTGPGSGRQRPPSSRTDDIKSQSPEGEDSDVGRVDIE